MTTIGRPRVLSAELAFAAQCELAEGPVWDDRRQLLLWVDILAGNVHTLDTAGGAHSLFSAGMPVGAVGLAAGGGLVLALANGFAVAETDGRHLRRVADFQVDTTTVRFNDGKPDPWGGFCAGTMRWRGSTALGSFYRLTPKGDVTELVAGVEVSKGWTGPTTFAGSTTSTATLAGSTCSTSIPVTARFPADAGSCPSPPRLAWPTA